MTLPGRPAPDRVTWADLGRVAWRSTALLALSRGAASGLIWGALLSLAPDSATGGSLLLMPLAWAVGTHPA
jgi:hypothetical protein